MNERWLPREEERKKKHQQMDKSNLSIDGRIESDLANFLSKTTTSFSSRDKQQQTDNQTLCLPSLSLENIPPSVLDMKTITSLILDHNNLTTIPESLCNSLILLHKLSLVGNEIKTLPDDIGLMLRLSELHLTENRISRLPSSICSLNQLKILRLSANNLRSLPWSIGSLCCLREIYLSENKLKDLPQSFAWLTDLEICDLSENKLQILPQDVGSLHNLRILNLESNYLSFLPETFENLTNIEILDVSNNRLSQLMPRMKNVNNLEKLYANCNFICQIPDWFDSVVNLVELSMRNNTLRDNPFPEAFGKMATKLKIFDLAGNFVSTLCQSFGGLSGLEVVNLGSIYDELERRDYRNGNWISRLPTNFGDLKILKELYLDENQVLELPENFGDLANLEILDLGQNNLEVLPESFGKLKSLVKCQLSMNKLNGLPENFGDLMKLVDLRLDNNLIDELPESFSKLTQLEMLDLFNNKLKVIPPALRCLNKLTKLDIDENDFGLPLTEIPIISFTHKLKPTNSELKDKWRGKTQFTHINGVDLTLETKLEDVDETVKTLQNAILHGRELWQIEGQRNEEKRKIESRKDKRQIPEWEENFARENGDDDSDDVGEENCDLNEDKENVVEDWDKEIEETEAANCPYDDVPKQEWIYIDPMNMHKFIDSKSFCPSDLHPIPIYRRRKYNQKEQDGQFEDAD